METTVRSHFILDDIAVAQDSISSVGARFMTFVIEIDQAAYVWFLQDATRSVDQRASVKESHLQARLALMLVLHRCRLLKRQSTQQGQFLGTPRINKRRTSLSKLNHLKNNKQKFTTAFLLWHLGTTSQYSYQNYPLWAPEVVHKYSRSPKRRIGRWKRLFNSYWGYSRAREDREPTGHQHSLHLLYSRRYASQRSTWQTSLFYWIYWDHGNQQDSGRPRFRTRHHPSLTDAEFGHTFVPIQSAYLRRYSVQCRPLSLALITVARTPWAKTGWNVKLAT